MISRRTKTLDGSVVALAALGSNLPWRELPPNKLVVSAISRLSEFGNIEAQSGLWRSPAWPDPSHPEYVNAVVRLRTALPAEALLAAMHEIETAFGRVRSERWGDRTLDLDLIDYGGQEVPGEQGALTLPHPRAHERAFVLLPLCDVAPAWRHPILGLSVQQLLARLPHDDRIAVRRWTPDRA